MTSLCRRRLSLIDGADTHKTNNEAYVSKWIGCSVGNENDMKCAAAQTLRSEGSSERYGCTVG